MLWLALYPFGGFTLLPFLTGHTTRFEMMLVAIYWPAVWVLVAWMFAAEAVKWVWRGRWLPY